MSRPAQIVEFPLPPDLSDHVPAPVPSPSIPRPDDVAIRFDTDVPQLVDAARSVVVNDQESLDAASKISAALTRKLKEVDETFDPIIDHYNKGHKLSLQTKARYANPLSEAIRIIKNDRIGGYLAEQKRKEQEAREAAWRAEQEKIRLQREAIERVQAAERKAAEERRVAEDKARREAEELEAKASRARSEEARKKAQDEADRVRREAAARAKEQEAAAQAEQDRIRREADARAAAVITPEIVEPVKADGVSLRYDWDAEVVDAALVPREFMAVDEKRLRAYAKAMKDAASVPGVRFFKKPVTSQRIK